MGGGGMEDGGQVATEGGVGRVYPFEVKLHEFRHDVEAGNLYLDNALVAVNFLNGEIGDSGMRGRQGGVFHEAAAEGTAHDGGVMLFEGILPGGPSPHCFQQMRHILW